MAKERLDSPPVVSKDALTPTNASQEVMIVLPFKYATIFPAHSHALVIRGLYPLLEVAIRPTFMHTTRHF